MWPGSAHKSPLSALRVKCWASQVSSMNTSTLTSEFSCLPLLADFVSNESRLQALIVTINQVIHHVNTKLTDSYLFVLSRHLDAKVNGCQKLNSLLFLTYNSTCNVTILLRIKSN